MGPAPVAHEKKVYLAMILPIGLPVMFPIAASAELSWIAAVLLANVSGILVPNATRVIPVTLTCNPIIQPSNFANLKWNEKLFTAQQFYLYRFRRIFHVNITYLFKDNNKNTKKRCETCSKLTIKTPERRHVNVSWAHVNNFGYYYSSKCIGQVLV